MTGDPRVVRITQDGCFAAPTTKRELEQFAVRHAPKLPTAAQLEKLYTDAAKARLASGGGTHLPGSPVPNPNDFPHYNMTPPGLMDAYRTLFVINDRLVFRTSGMGPTGVRSNWTDLGPAPTF